MFLGKCLCPPFSDHGARARTAVNTRKQSPLHLAKFPNSLKLIGVQVPEAPKAAIKSIGPRCQSAMELSRTQAKVQTRFIFRTESLDDLRKIIPLLNDPRNCKNKIDDEKLREVLNKAVFCEWLARKQNETKKKEENQRHKNLRWLNYKKFLKSLKILGIEGTKPASVAFDDIDHRCRICSVRVQDNNSAIFQARLCSRSISLDDISKFIPDLSTTTCWNYNNLDRKQKAVLNRSIFEEWYEKKCGESRQEKIRNKSMETLINNRTKTNTTEGRTCQNKENLKSLKKYSQSLKLIGVQVTDDSSDAVQSGPIIRAPSNCKVLRRARREGHKEPVSEEGSTKPCHSDEVWAQAKPKVQTRMISKSISLNDITRVIPQLNDHTHSRGSFINSKQASILSQAIYEEWWKAKEVARKEEQEKIKEKRLIEEEKNKKERQEREEVYVYLAKALKRRQIEERLMRLKKLREKPEEKPQRKWTKKQPPTFQEWLQGKEKKDLKRMGVELPLKWKMPWNYSAGLYYRPRCRSPEKSPSKLPVSKTKH